jgi:hypothetical protein
MSQCGPCHVPDCVAGLVGRYILLGGQIWPWNSLELYLTVRACNSVGAPDTTAAGSVSPGSLPSMTCVGTGENVLPSSVRLR